MIRSAIVVGAGFGGIAAAIALRQAGVQDLTILERGEAVGGVWHHNTYPGAACDVPVFMGFRSAVVCTTICLVAGSTS